MFYKRAGVRILLVSPQGWFLSLLQHHSSCKSFPKPVEASALSADLSPNPAEWWRGSPAFDPYLKTQLQWGSEPCPNLPSPEKSFLPGRKVPCTQQQLHSPRDTVTSAVTGFKAQTHGSIAMCVCRAFYSTDILSIHTATSRMSREGGHIHKLLGLVIPFCQFILIWFGWKIPPSATLRHWKRPLCATARIEHTPAFPEAFKRHPKLLLSFR